MNGLHVQKHRNLAFDYNSDSPMVESPKMTNMSSFINEDKIQKAEQMLNQTYAGLEYTEYANWLGLQENRPVLSEFLRILKPWPSSLYSTLSKLSSNLYLIAEAGPLDTILEELARQWVQMHGQEAKHYGNDFKICHIVLFSLLILNSDLHNETFDYKFTMEQFIDNTLYAVRHELKDIELDEIPIKDDLRTYYKDILENQFPLCGAKKANSLHESKNDVATPKVSNMRSSYSVSRKTSIFSLRPSSNMLERAATGQSTISAASEWSQSANATDFYVHETQDEMFGKQNDTLWMMDHSVNYKMHGSSGSAMEPLSSPFNHGIMKLFGRSNNLNQQQRMIENANRNMRKVRVTVQKGSLELHLSKSKSKLSHISLTGHGRRSNGAYIQRFNLFGAFAECIGETIINSTGCSKPKCFQVEFPDALSQKQLIFECSSSNQCERFVNCINFWSSRITPIPDSQFEMVCNQEYGWSEKLLDQYSHRDKQWRLDPNLKVVPWEPLHGLDSIYTNFNANESGKLTMDSQLLHWKLFVKKLLDWITEHHHIKPVLIKIWSKSQSFELVMDNWNKKYLYLNRQYHKHNEYLKALEKGYEKMQ